MSALLQPKYEKLREALADLCEEPILRAANWREYGLLQHGALLAAQEVIRQLTADVARLSPRPAGGE